MPFTAITARTTATCRPRVLSLVGLLWMLSGSAVSLGQPIELCSAPLGAPTALSTEALPAQLEVLSWNIQKASNSGWKQDLEMLTGGVNLAFIQEASTHARIPQALSSPLHPSFAVGYTTNNLKTGVMTLSSSSPSMYCKFTSWEPWLGTPKATSITEYPLAGRDDRLLAINVHAVNFAFDLEGFEQQFQLLAKLLDRHQGPVILAGDLNTWSSQRQQLVDEFTQTYGLDAVAFLPDLRTTTFGRALDHIYIRGLQAEAAEVIPVTTSDHNPLRVRLGFY